MISRADDIGVRPFGVTVLGADGGSLDKTLSFTRTSTTSQGSTNPRELYSNFNDKRDILAAVITKLQARLRPRQIF